jgi:pilus assembly protein CpaD
MPIRRVPATLLPGILCLVLALAACRPAVTEYSESEAPNMLRLDPAESRIDLAFAGGSERLAPGEARRLDRLLAGARIRPEDRIAIAAAGERGLADRRAAVIAAELLRYGVVAGRSAIAAPPNRAIVTIAHYTVTLPACPNWSKPSTADFTNALASNWGCATAVNLGLIVASPADLASGRPLGPAEAIPAVNAVERYMTDKVQLPAQNIGLPVASGTPTAPPAATPPAGGP